MSIKKFTFQHNKDSFFESLGVDETEMDQLEDKFQNLNKELGEREDLNKSEVLEEYYNAFTKEELVVILVQTMDLERREAIKERDKLRGLNPDGMTGITVSSPEEAIEKLKEVFSKLGAARDSMEDRKGSILRDHIRKSLLDSDSDD